MKKGKNVRVNVSNNFKSTYGTVDCKELKSIYINIQSWVTPKTDLEGWTRIVGNLNREIKHTVHNSIDKELFVSNSIVDLDLRTSGILFGKKSFLNLEINLFADKPIDFKSNSLKSAVKKIIHSISEINVNRNEFFDFTLTKK